MIKIKKTTIKDVAVEAGVSQATVSYVINQSRDVQEETKKKVFKAIQKLNYKPNKYFQNLKNAKNNVVGVIVPSIDSSFFSKVLQGINDVFSVENNYFADYSITISSSGDSISEEIRTIKALKARVKGLIIAPTISETSEENERKLNQSYLHHLFGNDFPLIFLDRNPQGYKGAYKIVKSKKSKEKVKELINYLINMGHRNIGMISGKNVSTIKDRENGYEEALIDNSINIDYDLIRRCKINVNSSCKMAKDLIKNQSVSSIFTINDELTLGIIKAVNELQLKIPGDISVVGFDDYEWAEIGGFTTIKQPAYQIGKSSALQLLKILHPEIEYNFSNNLDCEIKYRNSVGEGPFFLGNQPFVYIKNGIVFNSKNNEVLGILKNNKHNGIITGK